MRQHGTGIYDKSSNIAFTPLEVARDMLYYPMWVGHFYCADGYRIDREEYEAVLLAYVLKGKFHVQYRGEEKIASAGDVIFIDCREKHCYFSEEGLEFIFVNYTGLNAHEICQYCMNEYGWIVQKKSNVTLKKQLLDMVQFFEKGGIESPFRDSGRIYAMMETMLEQDFEGDPMDDMIYRSIAFIREHATENMRLQDLADEANLSIYYYSHKFKERTGFAPMDYLTNTRIEKAKALLIETDMSIEEIAGQVGYAASAGLIKAFKKVEGVSPNRFRKLHFGR